MGKYKRANAKLKRQTENMGLGKNFVNTKVSTNDVGKKISIVKHNRWIDSMCFPANMIRDSSKKLSKAKHKGNISLNCKTKVHNSKPSNQICDLSKSKKPSKMTNYFGD